MSSYSLYSISSEIYRIFRLYYMLHGVRISLFTPRGDRIYPTESQPDCNYCRLLRQELDKDSKCKALDKEMIHQCITENKMIRYTCHGNMEEAAIPLVVEDQVIGCIMLGQFRKSKGPKESGYLNEWQKRIGDQRLEKAFGETPLYSEDKIPILFELYGIILGFITKEKLIRHKDYDRLVPIIEEIQNNPSSQMSLSEAAELIGRSTSTTSRMFVKVTGKSFKTYIIETKLDKADQLMKENPFLPIAEISSTIGYDDPLYFSRLYKRYRGMAPSKQLDTFKKDMQFA